MSNFTPQQLRKIPALLDEVQLKTFELLQQMDGNEQLQQQFYTRYSAGGVQRYQEFVAEQIAKSYHKYQNWGPSKLDSFFRDIGTQQLNMGTQGSRTIGMWYLSFQNKVTTRRTFLDTEVERIEGEIKQVNTLNKRDRLLSNFSTGITCLLGVMATMYAFCQIIISFVFWTIGDAIEYTVSYICLVAYSCWALYEHHQYCQGQDRQYKPLRGRLDAGIWRRVQ